MSNAGNGPYKLDELRELLGGKIQALPCLPPVLLGVQKAIAESDVGARELARVIMADPSLTARVLKMANSVYFASQHRIRTVTQAILIMGFETVRNLVLGLSVYDMLSNLPKAQDYRSVWRHSLCCAVCSRYFAQKLRSVHAEQAFVAGLLHDIGKLIMGQFFAEEYAEVDRKVRDENLSYHQAETKVLGFTHEAAGCLVAEHWGFPQELTQAVSRHEATSAEELGTMNTQLQRIVGVANQSAMYLYREDAQKAMTSAQIQSFCQRGLGIGPDALLDIFAQIKAEVSHTARLLNISIDEWKYAATDTEEPLAEEQVQDARLEFMLLSSDLLAEEHPFAIYWRQAAEALAKALKLEAALLLVHDEAAHVLKVRSSFGQGVRQKTESLSIGLDAPDDPAARAYLEKKAVGVTDENLSSFSRLGPDSLTENLGTCRLAAAPVKSTKGLAVLVVARNAQDPAFDGKDMRLVSAFSRDLSQALDD